MGLLVWYLTSALRVSHIIFWILHPAIFAIWTGFLAVGLACPCGSSADLYTKWVKILFFVFQRQIKKDLIKKLYLLTTWFEFLFGIIYMVLFYSDKENSNSLVSHKSAAKFCHQGPATSKIFPIPRTLSCVLHWLLISRWVVVLAKNTPFSRCDHRDTKYGVGCGLYQSLYDASVNSSCAQHPLPTGSPPGISLFFRLGWQIPGVGTPELSNPPGWGRKKRANALSSVNTPTFFIDRTVESCHFKHFNVRFFVSIKAN